jgi:PknH-like extracellular domain
VAASTISVVDLVIAGIWLVAHSPAHQAQTCDAFSEMIRYTERQTWVLNDELVYSKKDPPPIDKDLPDWANGMRQYAELLKESNKYGPSTGLDPGLLTWLANDAQEIVYLFQYAENAAPPFTGKNPPPLWMTRYNEVAYEMEMIIQILESNSPTCAAIPAHPKPPGTAPTTTATPALAGGITDNTSIADKLLKPSELVGIIGDPDMTEVSSYGDLEIPTQGVDPLDCAARTGVGNTFAYYGPGRAAIAAAVDVNPNLGAHGPKVNQLVTVWKDSEQPKMVVSQSAYEWEHYCQQPYTITVDNSDSPIHWVPAFGLVERDSPTSPTHIVTWDRPTDRREICYHVMASRANILAEDSACGRADTHDHVQAIADQAKKIADLLLNNFSG